MVMDIIVIAVIVLSTVIYARQGFAVTFVNFIGWIAGIVCGLIFCGKLRAFLCEHTKIDDAIYNFVSEKITSRIGSLGLVENAPDFLKGATSMASGSIADKAADGVATLVMTLLSFFLILLLIRIVGLIIVVLFSKKHHHGVIGAVDTVGGVVLGLVLGVLYVVIGLTVLYFLMNVLPDKASTFIEGSLESSHISGFLYENNPLLMFILKLTGK